MSLAAGLFLSFDIRGAATKIWNAKFQLSLLGRRARSHGHASLTPQDGLGVPEVRRACSLQEAGYAKRHSPIAPRVHSRFGRRIDLDGHEQRYAVLALNVGKPASAAVLEHHLAHRAAGYLLFICRLPPEPGRPRGQAHLFHADHPGLYES
jgi:hypothetical protein